MPDVLPVPEGAFPKRIAVLHLDSLVCLPAMNELFAALGDRIVLVVSSERAAGIGGLLREWRRSVARSGLAFTLALGFDIVALRIAAALAPVLRWPPAHRDAWRSPRELAAGVGAAWRTVDDINGVEGRAAVVAARPDLVVALHFDQILQPAFLAAVNGVVLNVHPALLPAHRGPCPAFWTLLAGDAEVGATVHAIVDASIDSGPVVAHHARPRPRTRCMGELDEVLLRDGVAALLSRLGEPVSRSPAAAGVAPPGPYESFPDRATVRRARRAGVRLWRLAHAARLIAGLFGWWRR